MMDKKSTLTINLGFKRILETDTEFCLLQSRQCAELEATLVQSINHIVFTGLLAFSTTAAVN